jgi:nucleoid DNA-binding protein
MKNQSGITILAQKLGVDDEQAGRRLDEFSGSMIAELLEKGRLDINGLGTFAIEHEPATKEKNEKGVVFLPPRNRVAYEPQTAGRDDAVRLAVQRLGMNGTNAGAFSRALAAFFTIQLQHEQELEFRGFGSFSIVEGVYGFHADPSLEDLLNNAYDELNRIVIPASSTVRPAARKIKGKPVLRNAFWYGAAALAVTGALVIAVMGIRYFNRPDTVTDTRAAAGRQGPVPMSEPSVPRQVAGTVSENTQGKESSGISAGSAQPDSILLEKDRFTIVAATFRTKRAAVEQLNILNAQGPKFYLWTVPSGRVIYYRLAYGSYPSFQSAHDSLSAMPAALSKEAYIQKVQKNAVLYGQQSL